MTIEMDVSPCCKFPISENRDKQAKCSGCGEIMLWAFYSAEWARQEACGVFEDFQGKKHFAWQIVSRIEDVKRLVERGNPCVCYVKETVATIGQWYNTQDTDMVSDSSHRAFVRYWMPQVVNPEMGAVLLERR